MSLDLPDSSGLTVALDTEASGLFVDSGARVSVVSLAWGEEGEENRVYPFDHGVLDKGINGFQANLLEEDINLSESDWIELCDWLQRQWLVFHNAKFDLHIMAAGHRVYGRGVDLSNRVRWDTQVVNPIFFPNEPTGLKPTSARLWGDQERDTERALKRWLDNPKHKVDGQPRYDLAPWELVSPYAAEDAIKTIRLYYHQQRMMEAGEVLCRYSLIEQEIDLAICLFRMEQRGVGFDVEACDQAAQLLRKASTDIRVDLRRKWRRDVTPAGAAHYFFTQLGETPVNTSEKTGKASADQESIKELVLRGVPTAKEYQTYAMYQSALSKWYEAWPKLVGADGRLRPSFHQTKIAGQQGQGPGTINGRLSVERVQLQAIPHDFRHTLPDEVPHIRSLFRAAEGHELWEVDISQAEVRVATWAAKCLPMWQVLCAGDDVHGQTATKVFGVTEEDAEWSKYRTLAKRLTFGTLYGFGPATFQRTIREQVGIVASLQQCREWLDEYRGAFPEFRKLYYTAADDAKRRGFVILGGGRKRYFSDFERQFKSDKAFNAIIQGSVAEAMKRIKVEVEVTYPGILLNEIHDSLMLEVVQGDEGRAQVKLVEDLMLTVLEHMYGRWDDEHVIPWKVDAKIWT